jgi:maltose O-acetyltransferase
MRERMLAGDLYIADDPELGEHGSAALDLMAAYNATTVRQGPLRRQLLTELLGSVGEGTEIRPPFYVDYGSHIRIGARCFANSAWSPSTSRRSPSATTSRSGPMCSC